VTGVNGRPDGYLERVDLEEHSGVEDNIAETCSICGAPLSRSEIETSRETGAPFVCSVHANEELPVAEAAPDADDPLGA
jgi:hypothetical protein